MNDAKPPTEGRGGPIPDADAEAVAADIRPSFLRYAFSFPVLLAVGLIFLLNWTANGRFNDPDTWWHLKVGEQIWETGALPTTDEFSYTTDNHDWLPHPWLADLTMYAAYRAAGLQGLFFWLILLGSCLVLVIYIHCAASSGNAKTALLGGLAAWFFATITLSIRPLMLGHLFLALELLLLHLGKTRDRRWLWGLPIVFALWVNCHGSFFLGMALLIGYAVISRLEFRWGLLLSKRWPESPRLLLPLVVGASFVALFINPVGIDLVTYPLDLMFSQSDNLNFIYEWRTLDFADPRGIGLFVVLAFMAALVLFRKADLYLDEVMLLGIGSFLALQHMRMLFVFGILAAPLLCRLVKDDWDSYEMKTDKPLVNAAAIVVALAVCFVRFPSNDDLRRQIEARNPVAAVSFMREQGIQGRVLNEYTWGGYLIWQAPEYKTFIDGRTDIFDYTGVLNEYIAFHRVLEDPKTLLEKYDVEYCLLNKDTPVVSVLGYLPNWEQVYADDLAVIFSRTPDQTPVPEPTESND